MTHTQDIGDPPHPILHLWSTLRDAGMPPDILRCLEDHATARRELADFMWGEGHFAKTRREALDDLFRHFRARATELEEAIAAAIRARKQEG